MKINGVQGDVPHNGRVYPKGLIAPLTTEEVAEFRLLAYRRLAGQFPNVRSRDVRAYWGAESLTMEFDLPGSLTKYGYVTEAYVLANRGTPQGREVIVDAIIYEALGDEWESDL